MIKNFDDLSREQKREWYGSLKVGDEVAVKRSSFGFGSSTTYHKTTVQSITKTGRINVLVGGLKQTFTNDGRYWGNRGDSWSRISYQLRQVDETFVNHRRKVIAQTMFEESMKKLENSYKTIGTVEEIERYADAIGKAIKELKL